MPKLQAVFFSGYNLKRIFMKNCKVCDSNDMVFCERCGFGRSLRRVRKQKGMTQVELAKSSGLESTAVSQFEIAARTPHLKNIISLCYALNCKPNDLIHIG